MADNELNKTRIALPHRGVSPLVTIGEIIYARKAANATIDHPIGIINLNKSPIVTIIGVDPAPAPAPAPLFEG